MKVTHRSSCRGCFSSHIKAFLSLGNMPLAGGFLKKEQIPHEVKIPLIVYFCKDCGLVQIVDIVNPHDLFSNYFYSSSVIPLLVTHFKQYATYLKKTFLKNKQSKLFEFGCNDGVLLEFFKSDKTIQTLGIDPSENITKIAREKKLNVITGYFDTKWAQKIKSEYGQFDVVTGSNVFAHIDNIHEIMESAKILMKKDAVFIIEVHYLANLIKTVQYDTIYHEHLSYYSVFSLQNIYKKIGLKIIDVQLIPMHGGGIRVVAAKEESRMSQKKIVAKIISQEKEMGLHKFGTFRSFEKKVIRHKKTLLNQLDTIKKTGANIVGYGAAGRGTILLNFCGIDKKYLDYIVDSSPLRAGTYMPGVHIPIFPPEKARKNPPDYFFVIAWNYFDSIMEQEQEIIKKGVKFLSPFCLNIL